MCTQNTINSVLDLFHKRMDVGGAADGEGVDVAIS